MPGPADIDSPGPLQMDAAAAQLRVSRSTLRRWIEAGAPVSRRGRRGRGGAMLVEPAAIAAWRAAQVSSEPDPHLRAFAARIPQLLADAAMSAFVAIDGPHKRPCAAVLAAAWYAAVTTLNDGLRAEGIEVADPTAATVPEKITRLRAI